MVPKKRTWARSISALVGLLSAPSFLRSPSSATVALSEAFHRSPASQGALRAVGEREPAVGREGADPERTAQTVPDAPFAVVCGWSRSGSPNSAEYPFYMTNLGPDSLDAHTITQTYAARWKIELIFKELKSHHHLDDLPTGKAYIVETLLLGPVITLLVGRRVLQAVR